MAALSLCAAVVVTTGTFLGGVIHRGLTQEPAGRVGEKPSLELSRQFRAMSLPLGRLKTGTPARIVSSSIDWAVSISSMATIRRSRSRRSRIESLIASCMRRHPDNDEDA